MIHIKTEKLTGEEFDNWMRRAIRARNNMIDDWRQTGVLPDSFNKNIWKDLKNDFLLEIHNNKCAYCEGDISGNADLHVEHYRPKGKVTERRNGCDHNPRECIGHSGYFWLVYEWYNLILSCPYCNTYHTTQDQKERKTHPGKLNEFRISGIRVLEPTDNPDEWFDELSQERPLLLHPYFDDPEEHITFDEFGVPYSKNGNEKGKETIEVCDLNREELNEKRRNAKRNNLHRAIIDIFNGDEIDDINKIPYSSWLKHCVKQYITNLGEQFNV